MVILLELMLELELDHQMEMLLVMELDQMWALGKVHVMEETLGFLLVAWLVLLLVD